RSWRFHASILRFRAASAPDSALLLLFAVIGDGKKSTTLATTAIPETQAEIVCNVRRFSFTLLSPLACSQHHLCTIEAPQLLQAPLVSRKRRLPEPEKMQHITVLPESIRTSDR